MKRGQVVGGLGVGRGRWFSREPFLWKLLYDCALCTFCFSSVKIVQEKMKLKKPNSGFWGGAVSSSLLKF